jgi:tetratricopeptide (TPR) repeat protein
MALRLARLATDWQPQRPELWLTLGVAQYRTGDYSAAAVAVRKSIDLKEGGDAVDWLFLAAIQHQTGERDQAQKWFDQGVAWIKANPGWPKARNRIWVAALRESLDLANRVLGRPARDGSVEGFMSAYSGR